MVEKEKRKVESGKLKSVSRARTGNLPEFVRYPVHLMNPVGKLDFSFQVLTVGTRLALPEGEGIGELNAAK